MDTIAWIALILVIVVIIALIVLLVVFLQHRNDVLLYGIAYQVQNGVQTGANDVMTTGGNNLYIARSTSSPFTVTIANNPENATGRVIAVKNNSANPIVVAPGRDVTIDTGRIGATVASGVTAQYVNTAPNAFLRLS